MDISQTQRLLSLIGLYNAPIDGINGAKTQAARLEFCGNESISLDEFSEKLLYKIQSLPELSYSGGESLADAVRLLCKEFYHDNKKVWSYTMATVEHETNATFYPVEEAYYLSDSQRERYLASKKYGPKYYGRGLAQLTWEFNYKKYQDVLGAPLVENPDLALEPDTALFILIHGMLTGSYTGRKISDYINEFKSDYEGARRVVNGTDKAKEIAKLAKKWEAYYV